MESQRPVSATSGEAREQLRGARRAQDAAVRRARAPAWFIVVVSGFCGVQTVAPAYRGPGSAVTILAMALLMVALVRMSARNGWRPMRSWPKPRWGVAEMALIVIAVLVGGAVGPYLLSGDGDSAITSWGLGAAVAVAVAACLFGAYAAHRRRVFQMWQR